MTKSFVEIDGMCKYVDVIYRDDIRRTGLDIDAVEKPIVL